MSVGSIGQVVMASIGPLAKVCRLCGLREGPFANIFGEDCGLAARIAKLIPVKITEWDHLPHKVCFRCSAKVADLDDFVGSCVKTQQKFRDESKNSALQKAGNKRTREMWENRLKSMKVSNDTYCDDLIKKALEGLPAFKDGPLKSTDDVDALKRKFGLKELRIELTDFKYLKTNVVKPEYRKTEHKNSGAKSKIEILKNLTFHDVSKIDSIYSCSICHEILIHKDEINTHDCKKNECESPYPVGLLYRNIPQSGISEQIEQIENHKLPICQGDESSSTVLEDVKYSVSANVNTGKLLIKLNKDSSKSFKTNRRKNQKQKTKKNKVRCQDFICDSESTSQQSIADEDPLFLFQNIDPTSAYEPTYVLPINNTVQESQISTTTIIVKNEKKQKPNLVSKGSLKMFDKKRMKSHYDVIKGAPRK